MAFSSSTHDRILYFNLESKCFEESEQPNSWCIEVNGNFAWHFSDMDSDSNINLEPESALEVEAGYQKWRRYLEQTYNPHGQEGGVPDQPPKEIRVRRGWYADKQYMVSYDMVKASRASNKAIAGWHIEVYQQNLTTGFMRTLVRTPSDSIAKPYSGLQVNSQIYTSEGGLKIRVDIASGKSFFGYEFERTIFVFSFDAAEHHLATLVRHFCEDQELFRLEVPRDDREPHDIFAPMGSGRAVLVVKNSIEKFGIEPRHWKRYLFSEIEDDEKFSLMQFLGDDKVNKDALRDLEVAEGQPDAQELDVYEEKDVEEEVANESYLSLCKFDLYSSIRNCSCRKDADDEEEGYVGGCCEHRRLFDSLHVDEDNRNEYEEYHFGRMKWEEVKIPRDILKEYLKQMLESKNEIAYMVLENSVSHPTKNFEVAEVASGICKDAVYNKLVNSIRCSSDVFIVTVKISRNLAKQLFVDVAMCEDVEADFEFVTYVGFNGTIETIDGETIEMMGSRRIETD